MPEFAQGEIISYLEMCSKEGVNLQRGMNFHLKGKFSVILMNMKANAPYADRVTENGRVLIYEGHDIPLTEKGSYPKTVDQPYYTPFEKLTQNGLFCEAVAAFESRKQPPELVKVYEKIRPGIWVYNGVFRLTDAWQEVSNNRKVFKFKLELVEVSSTQSNENSDIQHDRMIPSSVKLEVWKRDKGRCILCQSQKNLHFDHIIPFSKDGSSLTAENIQLLCARHNLLKRDKIE